MDNWFFKKYEEEEYLPFNSLTDQIKMKFYKGGIFEFFIKFEQQPTETLTKMEDMLLSFTAFFGDVEYTFIKESSKSDRVFVSNTKNEKRILINIMYEGNILTPDENGQFYLEEYLALPGTLEFKVLFEIQAGFCKTFSEKSSFTGLGIDMVTSTEV